MSRKNKESNKVQIPEQRSFTVDAFQNVLARLGVGMPNMLESTSYPVTRLTQNFTLMNSLYRNHWIARRIIDVVPGDMIKNWYQIDTQLPPDLISKIVKLERTTKVKAKILEALKWGRLYGGSAAIVLIEGHDGVLDEPLDLDMVFPGSFKGLLVVDRWSGLYPSLELVTDINDPDFWLPRAYQVTNNVTRESTTVHHSRVLRFIGRDLPLWEKQAEVYWGAAELEHVYEELKKRDNTSYNIASLVFRANLNVLQMEGMDQVLAVGNDKTREYLYNTVQAQNWLMNNFSMFLLGQNDKFDTKQYTFSGLSDIYENFMMDVAGAAEIPVTKLFGRSPAGLNATGESDMQNYYELIEERQESMLGPVLDKLLPIMCMSELGAIPDDLDYTFSPVRSSSDSEMAELASKISSSVLDVFGGGLISQRTALKELRQSSDITGMWTNITDEDIEAADPNVQTPGEQIPDMGMLGGEERNDSDLNDLQGQLDKIQNLNSLIAKRVRDSQPIDDENKWITTKPKSEGSKGRKILLNERGEIIGGSVPKSLHGRALGEAFGQNKKKVSGNIRGEYEIASNRSQAISLGNKANGDWESRLSDDEKKVIHEYTDFAYLKMNKLLRGIPFPGSEKVVNEARERVEILSNALDKSNTETDFTVFRGADIDYLDGIDLSDLSSLIGKEIVDKGFSSTSIEKSTDFKKRVQLEIQVPKGSKAAYIENLSANDHEQEVILGKGSKFKIIDALKSNDNKIVVKMRLSSNNEYFFKKSI